MFGYIKVPLANRFTTERLAEKPKEPKADANKMKITADASQTPVCRFRGCVGVRALKIHLQRKLQTSSCLFLSITLYKMIYWTLMM